MLGTVFIWRRRRKSTNNRYLHRRIQDFVRGGKALLAPLDPRLTIWGSNFLWGGQGGQGPLAPPPWIRAWPLSVTHLTSEVKPYKLASFQTPCSWENTRLGLGKHPVKIWLHTIKTGIKPSDRINGLGHWTVPDLLIEVKVPGFKPSDRINGPGHWSIPGRSRGVYSTDTSQRLKPCSRYVSNMVHPYTLTGIPII